MSTSPTRNHYIFAHEDREGAAIERIVFGLPAVTRQWAEPTLDWHSEQSWYAVRIPTALLLPPGLTASTYPGDVDIMGGPLTVNDAVLRDRVEIKRAKYPDVHLGLSHQLAFTECVAQGLLTWPPSLSSIGAAELKSSSHFFDLKSTRRTQSRLNKAYQQAGGLSAMGFDRVAVIWIAVTEPVALREQRDGAAWIDAGERACRALDYIENRATIDAGQPFGQVMLSIGAVPGGLEHLRGSLTGDILRQPPALSRKPGSPQEAIRSHVQGFLCDVFSRAQPPRQVPVIIRACPPGGCGHVFLASPPENRSCPRCRRS